MITAQRASTVTPAHDYDAGVLRLSLSVRLTWHRRRTRLFWLVPSFAVNQFPIILDHDDCTRFRPELQ